MHLPAKAHYATVAMLALADKYERKEATSARQIACEHGIPGQFLGQILQQLRAAGLIASTRGASGGFYLLTPPSSITIGEVLDAVCPPNSASVEEASGLGALACSLWDELRGQQRALLDQLTLADLLARADQDSPTMFYI